MIANLIHAHRPAPDRQFDELAKDLARLQVEVKLVDADSPEGLQLVKAYDIMARPAVLLRAFDGSEIARWEERLPTAAEVSYLAHR